MSLLPLRILLVEDNEDDYIVIRDLLSKMANVAIELRRVETYDAGYAALKAERYDVCLLNYGWGDAAGLKLFQQIVASTPTPIILLAGSEDYDVDVAAAKAGAADYLLKGHINAPLLDRSIRYAIEHKRTNEALRRSEERYRAFIGNSTEAIWCCDLEQPIPVDIPADEQIDWFYKHSYLSECNEAMAAAYGFSRPQELVGARLDDLLVRSKPENAEFMRVFIRSHYRMADAESCEVDRHGVTKYFLNNLVGIIENGFVQRVWGTQRDITERRESEVMRAQLAAIVESSEDAIISKNLDGVITTWNTGAQNLYGYTAAEAVGQPVSLLIPSNRPDEIAQLREKTRRGESTKQYETVRLRQDGLPLDVSLSISPLKDAEGNIIGDSSIQRDITQRKRNEEALRESENEFRTLTEAMPQIIWVARPDGWHIQFNQRWMEYTGLTLEESLGHGWMPPFHPDDRPRASELWQRATTSGQAYEVEYRLRRADGEYRWMLGRALPLRDAAGHIVKWLGTCTDIHEQKQAEAILQESARELRELAEQLESERARLVSAQAVAKIGSWEIDLTTQTQIWSAETYRILELNPGQAQPTFERFLELVHPEERAMVSEAFAASFEQSSPMAKEHRFYMPGGRIKYVEQRWQVFHDEQGKPIRASGTVQDVTERKESEEALRISNERFSILSRATNDAVWDWNLAKNTLWWNEGFENLFGYNREEIEPGLESWTSRIYPDDLGRLSQSLHDAIESGRQVWSGEYSFRRADGSYASIFDRGFIIHDENKHPIRMVGSMQDITARKQAEEELRASEEKFQSIVANVPGMVYQFARHGDGSMDWPFVSEGSREMFEVEPDAIKQNPTLVFDMIHPDDRSQFDVSVATAEGMLLPWSWEGRLRMPSGEIKWIQGASYPQALPDGGAICTGLLMDITARKDAEIERDRFFFLSLDMMAIAGLDGYFKRVNPAFTEVLGFTEAELLSSPFLELGHPDDWEATETAVAGLAQGDNVVGFENRYRTKKGDWRWLEWKSVASPELGLIYAAARDVTDRKAAEASLLRMRDELEVRVQERTSELAQSNVSLQQEIGRRERAMREIRSRTRQQEAVSELGRRALANIDLDTLFNGATALISTTLDAEICGILEILPDKENFLVRAGVGLPEGVVGKTQISAEVDSPAGYTLQTGKPVIIADIQQELRFKIPELARKQGIISSMNVVIQSDEMAFGVLCTGSTQGREFTQDDVHALQSMANVLAAAIERRRIESEIRQLNTQLSETNERLRIENIERVMTLSALQEGALVLEQAREQAEQARENAEHANLAKSEFLSRMSHELRTPLNAILGFGQILEMRCSGEDLKQQNNIQQILKAGRHLLDLINEVLDISRIEAGHLSLSPEMTAVGRLLRESLDMMRPLAVGRDIELINEVTDYHAMQHVIADQQRLKQVILNLLSNAIKYNCDSGRVHIFCEIVNRGSEDETAENGDDEKENPASETGTKDRLEYSRRLRLSIRDTGPGLTASEISRLFTPFERLGAARTQVEGTGIGLALCKRLLEAMNGRIGVESVSGQGSTFWLELPLTAVPPIYKSEPDASSIVASNRFSIQHPLTILYIEDNLSNIELIQHVLADLSAQVSLLPAMQGSIGLEMAIQHKPDIILLDVNLPDISGDVVLNRLKADPATQTIPVVVLSADATQRQIARLLGAGADHYLTKPLDVEEFFKVLKQTFENIGVIEK